MHDLKSIAYQPPFSHFTLTGSLDAFASYFYIEVLMYYITEDNGAFYLLISLLWGANYPKTLWLLEKDQRHLYLANGVISRWLIIVGFPQDLPFQLRSCCFPVFAETSQWPCWHPDEVHTPLHPLHQTQWDKEISGLGGEQVWSTECVRRGSAHGQKPQKLIICNCTDYKQNYIL